MHSKVINILECLVNANSGRSVGSIADLDPVNNFYGSLAHTQNSHSSQYNESRMMPPPRQEMTKSGVSSFRKL